MSRLVCNKHRCKQSRCFRCSPAGRCEASLTSGARPPHLIRLGEHPQHKADHSRIQHGSGVEAQPGKVHSNLHPKVVTNIIWRKTGHRLRRRRHFFGHIQKTKDNCIWIAMCSMAFLCLFVSMSMIKGVLGLFFLANLKAASRTRPGPKTSSAGWGSSARAGETPAGWRRAHSAPGLQTYNHAENQASWIHSINLNFMSTRNGQLSQRKESLSLTDWLAFQEVDIMKHLPVFGP